MNEFTEKVMLKLSDYDFTSDQLKTIQDVICISMIGYKIEKEETLPAVYDLMGTEILTYLCSKRVQGCKDGTLKNYTFVLKYFNEKVGKNPNDINDFDIMMFLESFEKERKVSKCRKEQVRIVLNGFFRWLSDSGKITKNPMLAIQNIKCPKRKRKYLNDAEIVKMREACKTIKERALFEFFYGTGCRVSEVANCKKSDIDFENNTITVIGKGDKQRIVFLNAIARYYLVKYLETREDDNEYLFVSDRKPYNEMHKTGLERVIKEIGKRCLTRNVFCHLLRHSFATHMVQKNVPIEQVKNVMGHESIETTMVYVETNERQIKNNYEIAFSL